MWKGKEGLGKVSRCPGTIQATGTGQTGGSLVQQKFMHASASELAASVLAVLEFRWRIDVIDGKDKTWGFQPIFILSACEMGLTC